MECGCYSMECGHRSFPIKEEKIQFLKKYKEDLENESKGVAERIEELEDTGA